MHFGIIFIADQALLSSITMSFVILGAFGPMMGAIVLSRYESGKGAIRKHLVRIFKINKFPGNGILFLLYYLELFNLPFGEFLYFGENLL